MHDPKSSPEPPRVSTGLVGIVGASAFVIILILLLGQPILERGIGHRLVEGPGARGPHAGRDRLVGGGKSPEKKAENKPEKKPDEPVSGEIVASPTSLQVAGDYPGACLDRVPPPNSPGTIAAFGGDATAIASLGTGLVERIPGRPPLAWSAGGHILATRGAVLWTDAGDRMGLAFEHPVQTWAWSPSSDCLLGIEGGALMVIRPPGRASAVVRGDVRSFSISPDGRRLAVLGVVPATGDDDGGFEIIVVALGSDEVSTRVELSSEAVMLGEWSPDSRRLYYWAPDGEAILSGDRLRYLPGRGTTAQSFLSYDDYLEPCGRSVIGVAGAGPEATQSKRLVVMRGRDARTITSAASGYSYASPACSFDAGFMVAVRIPQRGAAHARLALLQGDGSFIQELSPQDGLVDDHPIWGPPRTGVLYIRRRPSARAGTLWFFPEGSGGPRSLGLQVSSTSAFHGHIEWTRSVDWSADGPSGHPPG